jgi:hypothetical protein
VTIPRATRDPGGTGPRGGALALAAWLAACGGSTDSPRPEARPSPPLPGYGDPASSDTAPVHSSCEPPVGIELAMLEDFEFGAAGGFFVNDDVCTICQGYVNESNDIRNAGQAEPRAVELAELSAALEACRPSCNAITRTPNFFENPRVAEPIASGRCESRFALHVVGGPYVEWGGSMNLSFAPPVNVTDVDVTDGVTGSIRVARDYDGVTFWARLGGAGGNNLRVEVGERHTSDTYTGGPNGGPLCTPNTTEDNDELGCDKFGAYAQLRASWQRFMIPFAEMRQAGWGQRAAQFDLTGLMALSMAYAQGSWDFWIDDVAFYRQRR